MKLERDIDQLVTERDDAEEALSQAYYLITGRSPEWSNIFGYKEALEEIDDAQTLLRKALTADRPEHGGDECEHGTDGLTSFYQHDTGESVTACRFCMGKHTASETIPGLQEAIDYFDAPAKREMHDALARLDDENTKHSLVILQAATLYAQGRDVAARLQNALDVEGDKIPTTTKNAIMETIRILNNAS